MLSIPHGTGLSCHVRQLVQDFQAGGSSSCKSHRQHCAERCGGRLGYVLLACRTPRLAAATTMYRLQNAAVAVSAFCAFVASCLGLGSFLYWVCVLALIFAAAVSSIGCQGSSLSVEREWTKALCQGDSASLAGLNAGGQSSEVCKTLPRLHALRISWLPPLCLMSKSRLTSPGRLNAGLLYAQDARYMLDWNCEISVALSIWQKQMS